MREVLCTHYLFFTLCFVSVTLVALASMGLAISQAVKVQAAARLLAHMGYDAKVSRWNMEKFNRFSHVVRTEAIRQNRLDSAEYNPLSNPSNRHR